MSGIDIKLTRAINASASDLQVANQRVVLAEEKRAAWTQTGYGARVDGFQKASLNVAHGFLGSITGTTGWLAAKILEMPSAIVGGFLSVDGARDDAMAQGVRVWNEAVQATGIGNQYRIDQFDVEPRRANIAAVSERLQKQAPAAVTPDMRRLLDHIAEASAKSGNPTPELTPNDRRAIAGS